MKLIVLMTLFVTSLSEAHVLEEWDRVSDPLIMNSSLVRNFSELPRKAEVQGNSTLWGGDYWALKKGNINVRWNTPSKDGFDLNSPSRARVMNMSTAELAQLSPTEKYDIFTGRYDYPLVSEVSKIANKRAKIWEGICHGWSPATINHKEPLAKTLVNADGVSVPFGSSDIKALLSYYYAWVDSGRETHQMGVRCTFGGWLGMSGACDQDLNAGAFHLILTNRVGLENRSFVADMEIGREVWNHPVHRYESWITNNYIAPSRRAAPGTVRQVIVRTDVYYVDGSENFWTPVLGTEHQKYTKKEYEYELDLNSRNEIIGGKWLSKSRPDFLWVVDKAEAFSGSLSRLGELLND